MDTYIELQNRMKALRARKMTWQEIGDMIGISKALAWNVAHGKSDSVQARHYFGLPPKLVEVTPCAVCGEVHVQKTCARGRNTRPRYRRAGDFATQERVVLYDAMLAELGTSTTEILNRLLDKWIEFRKLP